MKMPNEEIDGGRKKTPTQGSLDRFSELPEHLLHRILSLVTAEDAAKTCVLSKRWLHIWSSTPVLNFDSLSRLLQGSDWDRNKFLNFVNEFLRRRRLTTTSSSVEKFRLRMSFFEAFCKSHVDSWVSFAVDNNVEELCIVFGIGTTFSSPVCYSLPQTIFLAKSLSILKLKGCILEHLESVCLPCLQQLSLSDVRMNDETFHRLVINCPEIQTFYVGFCFMLSEIQISSSKLRSMEVVGCESLKVVGIRAKSLQSFAYKHNFFIRFRQRRIHEVKIDVACCVALRSVSLEGAGITEEEVEGLVSRLPVLESLVLVNCDRLKHVRINSKSLKTLRSVQENHFGSLR